MVGHGDDAHVELDRDDGVACVHEGLEMRHESVGVGAVQPGGRLVQDVEGVPALGSLELGGELHPLCLTSGQLGGRLSEAEISEADVDQCRERAHDVELAVEEVVGLLDAHGEDLRDVAAAPGDLQRAGLVAGAVAVGALGVDRGEEEQLHHDGSFALAGRAATAGDVEGESARLVPASASLGRLREPSPHVVEQARIGGDVRAWGATDGLLVDAHDAAHPCDVAPDLSLELVGLVRQQEIVPFGGGGVLRLVCSSLPFAEQRGQCLADQAGLA